MSDDTPTQRFPSSGDDVPTQRMPQSPQDVPTQRMPQQPQPGAAAGTPVVGAHVPIADAAAYEPASSTSGPYAPGPIPPEKKSRGLLIGLIVAGALLVIALIVLIVVLTGRGDDPVVADTPTPGVTPTDTVPSETPSPSDTPTVTTPPAPPAASGPAISFFTTGTTTVTCDTDNSAVPLDIGWTTSGGNQVFFGVDTSDASSGFLYSDLPASGTSGDFPETPFTYTCSAPSHDYTITVVDSSTRDKTSETITVTRD